MHILMPKTNTLNIYDVLVHNFMTFKAYTTAVMNKMTYVSFLKVGWEQPLVEMGNCGAVLLQVYVSICAPQIIRRQRGLTQLLQK